MIDTSKINHLLIDVSNLAHRSYHAMRQFSTDDERPSGHVYGSFSALRNLISRMRPETVVFAYDRGAPWRKELVPTYKANRHAMAMTPTVPHGMDVIVVPDGPTREWSPAPDVERLFRGFPGIHLAMEGAEADDMLAAFVMEKAGQDPDGVTVLYTGDHDMWQLVSDDRMVLAQITKRGANKKMLPVWVDQDYVAEHMGVPPEGVAKIKALLGDVSDNIRGVQGGSRPGKKKALYTFVMDPVSDRFFDENEDMPGNLGLPQWLDGEVRAQREDIIKSHKITSLPFAVARLPRVEFEETPENQGHIMDVLAEFESESLLGGVRTLLDEMAKPTTVMASPFVTF